MKMNIDLNCDFIIRSKHDRKLNGTGKESYLSWHLETQSNPLQAIINDPKNKRQATINISYSQISFSVLMVIDYYRKRWAIESYFKVLKGGCCEVEECRLQEKKRLERYLLLFSIIAWRLYWMVHVGRADPETDSRIILTEIELKTLYCHVNKVKHIILPLIMTVNDAIRAIGKMGGHNGRKGDGNPGMITLWRGWIRLQDKVEMYEIMTK